MPVRGNLPGWAAPWVHGARLLGAVARIWCPLNFLLLIEKFDNISSYTGKIRRMLPTAALSAGNEKAAIRPSKEKKSVFCITTAEIYKNIIK